MKIFCYVAPVLESGRMNVFLWISISFFPFPLTRVISIDMLNVFQRIESIHKIHLFFDNYQLSFLVMLLYWNEGSTWIWSTRHCGLTQGFGLLISMLGKLNWFHLTSLITLVLLMWKWMGLFLRNNYLLRCWGWLFVLNWIGALTLSLLLKLPPTKLEPWLVLWSFFLLRLLFISINLPYAHACNTAVTSGLVPLFVTWNC